MQIRFLNKGNIEEKEKRIKNANSSEKQHVDDSLKRKQRNQRRKNMKVWRTRKGLWSWIQREKKSSVNSAKYSWLHKNTFMDKLVWIYTSIFIEIWLTYIITLVSGVQPNDLIFAYITYVMGTMVNNSTLYIWKLLSEKIFKGYLCICTPELSLTVLAFGCHLFAALLSFCSNFWDLSFWPARMCGCFSNFQCFGLVWFGFPFCLFTYMKMQSTDYLRQSP